MKKLTMKLNKQQMIAAYNQLMAEHEQLQQQQVSTLVLNKLKEQMQALLKELQTLSFEERLEMTARSLAPIAAFTIVIYQMMLETTLRLKEKVENALVLEPKAELN